MNIFKKYILIPLAAVFSVTATAQDNYAHLEKNATFNYETQEGEITLESYVTGVMKVTQEAKPIEVVMVLDYSTSMVDATGKYTSSDTYTKVVATKRYYSQNTKVKISGSTSYVSSQTADITGVELLNTSNSNITINYNGSSKQVYLIRRGSSSSSYNWFYILDGTTRVFIRQDGSFVKEYGTASSITSSSSTWPKEAKNLTIFPVKGNDRTFFCELGESTGNKIEYRADALRAAAANFVDKIYEHATDNNVTDRVGVIVFQGGGSYKYQSVSYSNKGYDEDYITEGNPIYLNEFPTDYTGGGTSQDGGLTQKSFIAKRFVDMSSQNSQKILKFAIDDRVSSGNTNVADGLYLTSLLINSFAREDTTMAKIVIVFSDGEPTDDKEKAVGYANDLKEAGWKIYSVFCNSNNPSSTVETFMKALSSDYPEATSTSSLGTKNTKDGIEYYKTAKEDLGTVFDKMTNKITAMAGTTYGTETLLKDFVNNTYFKMPDDIVQSDVKVYEQACTSVTGTSPNIVYGFDNLCIDEGKDANRCWHVGATEAAAASSTRPKLDIKIQRVGDTGYDGTQDRVLISGYDYSADDNWCGLRKNSQNTTGTPGGHRLVVKFPFVIKVQKDSTATGALKTNGEDSGIYEAIEDSNGKMPGETGYQETYADTAATNYPMPVIYFASLNISRDSLDMGESAIYDIYQTLPDSAETKVGRLSINGSGNGSDSKIMYGLAGGVGVKYRVVETDWNWAYHSSGTTQEHSKTIEQKSSTETTVPKTSSLDFKFDGNHITPAKAEEDTSPYSMFNHDEEYKVNKMTIPSH